MSDNRAAGNPVPAAADKSSPVDAVVRAFGKPKAGAIAEVTTWAIDKWNRPLSKSGGGGLVPARLQARFLRAAKESGLQLTAEDLIAEPRP